MLPLPYVQLSLFLYGLFIGSHKMLHHDTMHFARRHYPKPGSLTCRINEKVFKRDLQSILKLLLLVPSGPLSLNKLTKQ